MAESKYDLCECWHARYQHMNGAGPCDIERIGDAIIGLIGAFTKQAIAQHTPCPQFRLRKYEIYPPWND